MRILPVAFGWREVDVVDADGVAERRMAMVPLPRYGNVCRRQFEEGEEYPLAPIEPRSRASHNHYFAALNEGFENLPETETRFPTSEHFRKWALVEEGYRDEKNYVCESPAHAKQLALLCRSLSEFAVIKVADRVVRIWEAKSQSAAAMGRDEFEASKKAVLGRLEQMTGVPRGTLKKEAGRHA